MTKLQRNRLETGGYIDRRKTLSFTFNGKKYQGFEGDTIASALLANDVRVLGRSFKFHRPRGILSAGSEEPNALVGVSRANSVVPIVRATVTALEDGHKIQTQKCFPSVGFDFGRIFDYTHKLWISGFYNKTFIRPGWHWYEWLVRRLAGLGSLPTGKDETKYYHHNLHCDVVICGAGPAGLASALSLVNTDARVLIVEQDYQVGGSLLFEHTEIDGLSGDNWLKRARIALDAAENITVMTSCTVSGYYDHNVLTIVDRSCPGSEAGSIRRFWKVRAKQVIIATGAIEQPLVFVNNDRPGIMLATAALQYVNRYAVKPADSVLVATNNDIAYRTAFGLHDKGVVVPAIVDVRREISDSLLSEATKRRIPLLLNSVISEATGSKGVRRVRTIELSEEGKSTTGRTTVHRCSAVAMSGGLSPTVHLYSQARGRLRYDTRLGCFIPEQRNKEFRAVGAASGVFGLAEVLASGSAAACRAASAAGFDCPSNVVYKTVAPSGYGIRPIRVSPVGSTHRQWIDFRHDVTIADIELSVRENLRSIEHVKRYTTTGMSVDQGKTSNLNALSILAELTNRSVQDVGTTTYRPQYTPVPMGVIAGPYKGDLYMPERRLPAHDWHVDHGAKFDDYGGWKRPAYYAIESEDRHKAICVEAVALRQGVGLFDASPLGKIEVYGPGAAQFLDRIYVNKVSSLKPGRVRYGLMLNENGNVIDDGVFACLSDDHYLVNTTSGNADRIAAWLEEWHQCEWPQFDLIISPVTSQWGVVTVAGPNARKLVERLDSNIDFSANALPHMSITQGVLLGHDARVQRVSFSGELSFEISVPANQSKSVFQNLMAADEKLDVAVIGLEAILMLRTEKGFLHIGTDTDGTTNPLDLGFGAIVDKKESDFVGKRSLFRAADRRSDRRQIVGVIPIDGTKIFEPGGHFISESNGNRRSQGYITSACYSPTLGHHIGLGLLEGGLKRNGEQITIFDNGRKTQARIVSPVFYDPHGKRMHA